MSSSNHQNITISYKSIVRVVIVVLALFFMYLVREIIAILFVAVILSAAFDPWVDWLQKHKIPRSLSILMIYIIMIGIISLVIIMVVPLIVDQFGQLAKSLPMYYDRLATQFTQTGQVGQGQAALSGTLQSLSSNWTQTTKSVFSTLTGIFGGMISFFVVLVMVFYITVEENMLKKVINYFTPKENKKYIAGLIERMQKKMGMWLRGQLSICLIVGILVYVGLTILGVKYALLLALIAGMLELIPYIGPFLSGVPAIFIGFSDSLTKVILIIILYLVIQQLENHVISPKVMQKAVGLNPIIVIIVVLIGGKLGGMVGILLAVPMAAAIDVYLSDILPSMEKITK